jgi:hypothetical protein
LGKRVRIATQLIDADTGVHVWDERYDRSLDDIFALQDEITLSTVGAIEPSLRTAEIERVKRKRPENLDAYDLVLRAQLHIGTGMPEEARIGLAVGHFARDRYEEAASAARERSNPTPGSASHTGSWLRPSPGSAASRKQSSQRPKY